MLNNFGIMVWYGGEELLHDVSRKDQGETSETRVALSSAVVMLTQKERVRM